MRLNRFKTRIFAVILDNNGMVQNVKKMNKVRKELKLYDKFYTFEEHEKATFLELKKLFFIDYYFFYNEKEMRPLTIKMHYKTSLSVYPDTDFINTILQADTLKKLNDLSKPNPFANIDPKLLLIGLGVVGVIIYFITGGSLT